MKPKPFWLLNHFTVPLFMGDLSKVRVQIDCALTQPAHSRFWGNVVSQARYSRQGQVVRPKLDLGDIRHLWRMRKSPEAIQSTELGLAALKRRRHQSSGSLQSEASQERRRDSACRRTN